ncbi:MAG: CAP domain-containing protein [Candidatus Moranbacteria bacterium]|nr:CAP domain-containing protein [Candidatus Moranbacteria bacterium]
MKRLFSIIVFVTLFVSGLFAWNSFRYLQDQPQIPPSSEQAVQNDSLNVSEVPSPEPLVQEQEKTVTTTLLERNIEDDPLYDLKTFEKDFHAAVNQIRKKNSLRALDWNNEVTRVARKHSEDQAKDTQKLIDQGAEVSSAKIRHEGDSFGNNQEERLHSQNVYYFGASGENILSLPLVSQWIVAENDPTDVYKKTWKSADSLVVEGVTGWMNSKGHRENILSENYNESGVGVSRVGDFLIVTQVFIGRVDCGYETGQCCEEKGYLPYCFESLSCKSDRCIDKK